MSTVSSFSWDSIRAILVSSSVPLIDGDERNGFARISDSDEGVSGGFVDVVAVLNCRIK